ncbi:MAG TPA: hypothetical protein DEF82_02800 [Crocinitomicaceae bacterium]|nr:hypothetical protein [Crocinitomicaceae bacterium]
MTEEQFQKFMQVNGIDSADEAVQKMLEQLQQTIDPREFMTPSMREIAELSMEQLTIEYEQVQQKNSDRSSAQRKFITQRFEYEQNAARQTAVEQDSADA